LDGPKAAARNRGFHSLELGTQFVSKRRMATKAEEFKAETQRTSRPAAGKKTVAPSRSKVGAARAKDRYPNPTSHNESPRAAKKSAYELEPAQSPRPSRKSTRRSPTHVKTDSSLRIRAVSRHASPESRSQARGGRRS
jgi:hypothetical protein